MLVVAKDRLSSLEHVLGSHSEIEVLGEIPGAQLVGLRYHGIFSSRSTGHAHSVPSMADPAHRHVLQIISAPHVTPDTGTGLVHCAPGHGAEDYLAFRAEGLLNFGMLCHVNVQGKFCSNVNDIVGPLATDEGGENLVGLEVVEEGSKAIVRLLGRTGSLLAVEKFHHRYPYDWKTNEPVIVT